MSNAPLLKQKNNFSMKKCLITAVIFLTSCNFCYANSNFDNCAKNFEVKAQSTEDTLKRQQIQEQERRERQERERHAQIQRQQQQEQERLERERFQRQRLRKK
jgi:predicted Holliday junction resolvase-like endonuclease